MPQHDPTIHTEEATAIEADLRYVHAGEPGISRSGKASRFRYVDAHNAPIQNPRTLERIRSLAIPPAWHDVWICADDRGHIQATGYDEKGRKQYRYHPRWRAVRDRTKFMHLLPFSDALPRIRATVLEDIRHPAPSRQAVLAAVVRTLDHTHMRIGNETYARENHSFGLTTLQSRHVHVHGITVELRFRGKSGQKHDVQFHDRRVATIIRRCTELPGQELFRYQNTEGDICSICSHDVNSYLQESSGRSITAKDFRTWSATVWAAMHLLATHEPTQLSQAAIKRNEAAAIQHASEIIGNKPPTCRKYYVDPLIFETYRSGILHQVLTRSLAQPTTQEAWSLSPEERAVRALLHRAEQSTAQ